MLRGAVAKAPKAVKRLMTTLQQGREVGYVHISRAMASLAAEKARAFHAAAWTRAVPA
jgi:hypothetical protein